MSNGDWPRRPDQHGPSFVGPQSQPTAPLPGSAATPPLVGGPGVELPAPEYPQYPTHPHTSQQWSDPGPQNPPPQYLQPQQSFGMQQSFGTQQSFDQQQYQPYAEYQPGPPPVPVLHQHQHLHAYQPMVPVGPPKSKAAAALLAFFLGCLGIHNFYLGHVGRGIAQLVITIALGWTGVGLVVVGIWVLIDFICILTGSLRDSRGIPLQ